MFQKRRRWCFTGWPPPLLPPSRRRGSWPLGAPQPPACHQPERHGRAQSPGGRSLSATHQNKRHRHAFCCSWALRSVQLGERWTQRASSAGREGSEGRPPPAAG